MTCHLTVSQSGRSLLFKTESRVEETVYGRSTHSELLLCSKVSASFACQQKYKVSQTLLTKHFIVNAYWSGRSGSIKSLW